MTTTRKLFMTLQSKLKDGNQEITNEQMTTEQCTDNIRVQMLKQYIQDLNDSSWTFCGIDAQVMWNGKLYEDGRMCFTFGKIRSINKEEGYCLVQVYEATTAKRTSVCKTVICDWKHPLETFAKVEPAVLRLWCPGIHIHVWNGTTDRCSICN